MNPTAWELDAIRARFREDERQREMHRANGRSSQIRRRDTKKGHRR